MFLRNLDHPLLLLEITLCHFRGLPSRDPRTTRDIRTKPVRRSLLPTFLHQLIGPYNTNNCLLEFIFNIPQIHCINILWFCILINFYGFRCPNFGFPMVEYFVNFVNVGMLITKSKKRPMKGKKITANNCSNEFLGDLNIRWQRPRH